MKSVGPPYTKWSSLRGERDLQANHKGIGTWQAPAGQVKEAVAYAVKNGYKLVDCAYCYGNEDEVGDGLKEAFAAGIKRRGHLRRH